MPRNRPTHSVRHINGWTARLYLGDVVDALASPNTQVRDAAREHVCIRFRKAIWAKYRRKPGPTEPPHWIEWRDLTCTPLATATPEPVTNAPVEPPNPVKDMSPTPGKPFYDPYDEYNAVCDECFVCDELNNHHLCLRCPNNRPGAA